MHTEVTIAIQSCIPTIIQVTGAALLQSQTNTLSLGMMLGLEGEVSM